MASKKAERKAIKKVQKSWKAKEAPAGRDPQDATLDKPFADLVKAADSGSPSPVSARKVAEDDIALDIAIGGPVVRPYVEARDNKHGRGDPSNWGSAAMGMDADAHQKLASEAVADAAADHMRQVGPRKGRQ
jgi:hypothetical protein